MILINFNLILVELSHWGIVVSLLQISRGAEKLVIWDNTMKINVQKQLYQVKTLKFSELFSDF